MKKALVINLGWEQEPLLDVISTTGWELYGIHYEEIFYRNEVFKEVLIADIRDLPTITKFADLIKPDAVISDQCDYSHFVQAVLCEKYQLPGPRIKQSQISSNKFLQRSIASENSIQVPQFRRIIYPSEVYEFADEVGYPLILKPVDNRGSFGVSKVNSKEEVLLAYLTALSNSHSRWVIAEQFIKGFEVTVDGYCFQRVPYSLTLAKKGHIDEQRQVSVDIKYPGELPDDLYEKVLKNNEEVIRKLGYDFGMTHSEYMVTPAGEIYLIEAANRGGGVYTSEIIVPHVSGVDILGAYINDCLDISTAIAPKKIGRQEVILKFFSLKPGKIKAIEGVESVIKDPSLLKFRLTVQPGDIVQPIYNDANRHGFVIVSAEKDVRVQAQKIVDKINIIYEKN
ncbi:ATP-grasp domain-containing protein [Nostoc sp. C117]|uniref:ATP-grasp domain-containing protein n=1 Tax=Nostoc sp. C117 TaxID=3349875 RepID=UPI00370D29C7